MNFRKIRLGNYTERLVRGHCQKFSETKILQTFMFSGPKEY